MQKLVTSRNTIVSPTRLTSISKKSSASISDASFDASGGNSGKFVIHLTRNCQSIGLIWLIPLSVHLCSCPRSLCSGCSRSGLDVAAEHHQHESAQREDRYKAAQLHHARNNERVFIGGGVVVIAVSQNIVYRRSDAIGRGFHQSQPQIFGRVLDAHVVLRQFALRSDNLNRTGVRKLRQLSIRPRNLHVPKAHGLG